MIYESDGTIQSPLSISLFPQVFACEDNDGIMKTIVRARGGLEYRRGWGGVGGGFVCLVGENTLQ